MSAASLTALCVSARVFRAQPPRSTARCGWSLCVERLRRSWLWTGSEPDLLLRYYLALGGGGNWAGISFMEFSHPSSLQITQVVQNQTHNRKG